jgi:hypothetical protein
MGTLDAPAAIELRSHLQTCDACRKIHDKADRLERLLRAGFDDLRMQARPAALYATEQVALPGASDRPQPHPASRRVLGRAVFTRLLPKALVAALIMLAATGLYHWLAGRSSAAAFADVVRQLSSAQTVTYTQTYQVEGQPPRTYQSSAMEPSRLRTIADGFESIFDFAQGRQLQISHINRTASLIHLTPQKIRRGNYVAWLRSLPADGGRFLRQEDLDGKTTNVFFIDWPHVQITVWADVRTNLPMRVERVSLPMASKPAPAARITVFLRDFEDKPGTSQDSRKGAISSNSSGIRAEVGASSAAVSSARTTITMSNFIWDADLDESLFAMVAPEGYKFEEMDLAGTLTEEDALVESLRFWAQESDGAFPAEIDQLLEVRPKLIAKFDKSGPPRQEMKDAMKMASVVVNGVLFAQTLAAQENWHYAGRDVRLGQTDQILCWWKNEDGRTCRVISGDLGVTDMSPEQLAARMQSAASQPNW